MSNNIDDKHESEYTHGGSPDEVEMETCSRCGHLIPILNMPLHIARCRRPTESQSERTATVCTESQRQDQEQGQSRGRSQGGRSSSTSAYNSQLSHNSNIGGHRDDDIDDDHDDDDDDVIIRSPPRSRARMNSNGDGNHHRRMRHQDLEPRRGIDFIDSDEEDDDSYYDHDHENDHGEDEILEMEMNMDSHNFSSEAEEIYDESYDHDYDHDYEEAEEEAETLHASRTQTANTSSSANTSAHSSHTSRGGVGATTSTAARQVPRGGKQEKEVIDLAGDDDDDDDIEIQWPCPVCTLLNDGDSDRCEACGYNNHQSSRGRGISSFSASRSATRATARNMNSTTTTTTRPPDRTRRERLIDVGENELREAELRRRRRLQSINDLQDALTATVRRNTQLAHIIEANSTGYTTRNGNRNCNNSNGRPNQPSVMRTVGNSALLGSAIGAFSGMGSNQGVIRSALGGAVAGAVGGALSASLSPSAATPPASSNNLNRSQQASGMDVPRGYRVYRLGGPNMPYRLQMVTMGGGGGFDAIDNMSYERLLEVFGDGSENRRTDPEVLSSFPTSKIKDVEKELPADHRNCAICLDDFENGQERKTLPCLHGFHTQCIDRWLQSNNTCPVCKFNVQSSSPS